MLGKTCYLFTGHDVGHGVPDWVMPDWRIYRSSNLVDWTHVGTIDPADTYRGAGSTDCWAGDIAERNGKFYWFFSHRHHSTGVIVADQPEGPFRDALGHPLVDSFDPTIFIDDDHTPYIVYGHGDYKIARLQESMTELAEAPRPISLDRKGVFPVMDKNTLFKHGGVYYLGCSGYYATSTSLHGPYIFQGLTGKGWGLDTPYAHGDFFRFRGQLYHVWCHYRNRKVDRIRDSYLAPIHFDAKGGLHDDLRHLN